MAMIVKARSKRNVLVVSPNEDEAEEFKGILERVFGKTYQTQIFFENDMDVILK